MTQSRRVDSIFEDDVIDFSVVEFSVKSGWTLLADTSVGNPLQR